MPRRARSIVLLHCISIVLLHYIFSVLLHYLTVPNYLKSTIQFQWRSGSVVSSVHEADASLRSEGHRLNPTLAATYGPLASPSLTAAHSASAC